MYGMRGDDRFGGNNGHRRRRNRSGMSKMWSQRNDKCSISTGGVLTKDKWYYLLALYWFLNILSFWAILDPSCLHIDYFCACGNNWAEYLYPYQPYGIIVFAVSNTIFGVGLIIGWLFQKDEEGEIE